MSGAGVCAQWRGLGPPSGVLVADRSGAMVLVWFLLGVFGVGDSCRSLFSLKFVVYLL